MGFVHAIAAVAAFVAVLWAAGFVLTAAVFAASFHPSGKRFDRALAKDMARFLTFGVLFK